MKHFLKILRRIAAEMLEETLGGRAAMVSDSSRRSEAESESRFSAGFTMVELLVATGLFVIVISITSGIFVQALRSQRSVVALMSANDNASLSIEQMSREIRIGSGFSTNTDQTQLNFISQRAGEVTYRFNKEDNTIERNGVAISSRNVKITRLFFDLMGEELGDGQSTRVTIRLGVSAVDSRVGDIVTNLQTTVSSRQLDT